jgi:hypothetical protein
LWLYYGMVKLFRNKFTLLFLDTCSKSICWMMAQASLCHRSKAAVFDSREVRLMHPTSLFYKAW